MPKFILEPIDTNHRDWDASSHKSRCRVRAPDEGAARCIANFAFGQMYTDARTKGDAFDPWDNPERVSAHPDIDGTDISGEDFPPLVEIPDFNRAPGTFDGVYEDTDSVADYDTGAPWMDYPADEYMDLAVVYLREQGYQLTDMGEPLEASQPAKNAQPTRSADDDNISADNNVVTADGATVVSDGNAVVVGDEPTAGTNITFSKEFSDEFAKSADALGMTGSAGDVTVKVSDNDAVRKVRANRTFFRAQSGVLLRFLDEVIAGRIRSHGNEDPLWGTDDSAAEFNDLLREIRDELMRFNDLLEHDIHSEDLERSAGTLRQTLYGALKSIAGSTYGKTVQTGLGALTVYYMLHFATSIGLPEPNPDLVNTLQEIVALKPE